MAIYVKEAPAAVPLESNGLVGTTGTASIIGGVEKLFIVRSYPHVAMTEEQVLATAEASPVIPATYNSTFTRRRMKIQERRSYYAYAVKVTYTAPGSAGGGTGSLVRRTFSSVSQAVHMQVALAETVYGATADFEKGINVQNGEIKGLDVDSGYAQMTEIHSKPVATMTTAYIKTICENFASKATNSASFRGFDAHSVRLDGFNIGEQSGGSVPVTFTFLVGKNLTNQTIAGISGVSKNAFDFAWAAGQPQISNGWMGPGVTSIVVDKIYPDISFAFIDQ